MKRTTVFLDEQLLADAQRAADRAGVSFATLVREALSVYLSGVQTNRGLPTIAGQFASGTSDTSERVDEQLWRDPHA
jgi:hypothetical protein